MVNYRKIAREQGDYILTSVCRGDLESEFTPEELSKITDDDMETIAGKLADTYLTNGFWDDLQIIVNDILDKRETEVDDRNDDSAKEEMKLPEEK